MVIRNTPASNGADPGRCRFVHPVTGEPLRPTLTVKEAADIYSVAPNSMLLMCANGAVATLPRIGTAPWKIITAKAFRQLGIESDEAGAR